MEEGEAIIRLGDIAAIEQDVAIRIQRTSDRLQLGPVPIERPFPQGHGTQTYLPVPTMAKNLNTVEARAIGQNLGHLHDAIARTIKDDDFNSGTDGIDKCLVIRHRRIDKHDLLPTTICADAHQRGR
nr:hypothetical protein [Skermanella pratensis]